MVARIVNHFPNHFELTRKDNLIKNLKRYHRELARDGRLEEVGNVMGLQLCGLNLGINRLFFTEHVPTTFSLPGDTSLFLDEFRRAPHTTWIIKPGARVWSSFS